MGQHLILQEGASRVLTLQPLLLLKMYVCFLVTISIAVWTSRALLWEIIKVN